MKKLKLSIKTAIAGIFILAVVFNSYAQAAKEVELIRTDSPSTVDAVIIRESKNYKSFRVKPIERKLSNGDMFLAGYVLHATPNTPDSIKAYTVKWCLYEQVQIPCPDAGKKDKFGRVSQMSCAVFHCRIDVKCDSMQFVKPKKAYKFYSEALKESSPDFGYKIGVQDVKIDSVWINNR